MLYRRLTLLIVLALISLTVLACGGADEPEVDQSAQETQVAQAIAATQTAEAPTPTPEPTATPEPTPVPVEESTVEELGGGGLSDSPGSTLLTLADLPPGFEEIPAEQFGFAQGTNLGDNLVVDQGFAFFNVEAFQFIFGFTTAIPNPLERAGFDLALNDPEMLMESLIGGMGEAGVMEQQPIENFEEVGDSSSAITVVFDAEGVLLRLDVVVFRLDESGAFLAIMYPDEQESAITLQEVANILADNLAQ